MLFFDSFFFPHRPIHDYCFIDPDTQLFIWLHNVSLTFIFISQTIGDRHDIKLIMNTWTRQMGYPVITIIRDGDNYILQQDRFLLDGNSSLGPPSIYE